MPALHSTEFLQIDFPHLIIDLLLHPLSHKLGMANSAMPHRADVVVIDGVSFSLMHPYRADVVVIDGLSSFANAFLSTHVVVIDGISASSMHPNRADVVVIDEGSFDLDLMFFTLYFHWAVPSSHTRCAIMMEAERSRIHRPVKKDMSI